MKEQTTWKVWCYSSAFDDLAAALIAAKSDDEREELLEVERELVTVELRQALIGQGNRSYSQGSRARALMVYRIAQTVAEQIADKDGITRTLNNIGIVHFSQGNYAQALESCHKSLKISEELGDKAGIARTPITIGSVHVVQGNYAQALESYHMVLKIKEELGDKAGIAGTHNNIGIVHHSQGNYAQALEFYQKSLKKSEELSDKAGIARTLYNIGNVHHGQGNDAQALESYQKSLQMKEELGDEAGIALNLGGIGLVHHLQGNYVQALKSFQRSLKMSEELGDKASVTRTLVNIGMVNEMRGDYMQALAFLTKGLSLATDIGAPEWLFRSYWGIGSVHKAQGHRDEAFAAYKRCIEQLERIRGMLAGGAQEQQRFLEEKTSPYVAMVELLIEQNKSAEAVSYAERAKARVLLDVLQSGKINLTKAMTRDEQEKERKLNGELVSLNTQVYRENLRKERDQNRLSDLKAKLQTARLDYEAFQTDLYAAHPQLKVQRGEAKPLSLVEASSLVPDAKSALLEFVVSKDKAFLFVITKDLGLRTYKLEVNRDELEERVTRLHVRITRPREFSAAELSARKLYDVLLKPAASQLRGKTKLVIVPDDVLWELPFQALQTSSAHYLIEACEISYAPSLTVLREMMKEQNGKMESRKNGDPSAPPSPRPSTTTLLAMGNLVLSSEAEARAKFLLRGAGLSPLPHAEEEVKDLTTVYGKAQSKVYVGAEAREDRFKSEAARARIVHLATHGILNTVSPMYSHIVLAQESRNGSSETTDSNRTTQEDGMLEAWEIMNLDLQADLVVLSACETARGRISAGEGVIGLTWALFVAGCPSTVVSQWKVADESTSVFMVAFHRNLKAGMTKPAALRQAALKLLNGSKYNHPFYWAPFVLIGSVR